MNPRKRSRRKETPRRSNRRGLITAVRGILGPPIASRRQTILAFGRWVGLLVIGLAIMLLAWNLLIRFEHHSSSQSQDVMLFASYPRYLPTDDQGGIVITVVNTGQRPITDTVVSLVCGNTQYVCMDFGSTSRVTFGRLEPNERKTRLVKFQVNRIDSVAQKVQIDLELSAQHSTAVTNTLQHSTAVTNTLQHSTAVTNTLQHSTAVTNTLQHSTAVTNTLQVDPTIISFLPVGVTSLVLNRTFTMPNLLVALAAIVALVKSVTETSKAFREVRDSGSRD